MQRRAAVRCEIPSLRDFARSQSMATRELEAILARLGLNRYLENCRRECIDDACLDTLERDDIRELGLPIGPARRFEAALAERRRNRGSAEASPVTPSPVAPRRPSPSSRPPPRRHSRHRRGTPPGRRSGRRARPVRIRCARSAWTRRWPSASSALGRTSSASTAWIGGRSRPHLRHRRTPRALRVEHPLLGPSILPLERLVLLVNW